MSINVALLCSKPNLVILVCASKVLGLNGVANNPSLLIITSSPLSILKKSLALVVTGPFFPNNKLFSVSVNLNAPCVNGVSNFTLPPVNAVISFATFPPLVLPLANCWALANNLACGFINSTPPTVVVLNLVASPSSTNFKGSTSAITLPLFFSTTLNTSKSPTGESVIFNFSILTLPFNLLSIKAAVAFGLLAAISISANGLVNSFLRRVLCANEPPAISFCSFITPNIFLCSGETLGIFGLLANGISTCFNKSSPTSIFNPLPPGINPMSAFSPAILTPFIF